MHPKALSRLKGQYLLRGDAALTGAKPGPKPGAPALNRTPEATERLVIELARNFREEGPAFRFFSRQTLNSAACAIIAHLTIGSRQNRDERT